ncbi:MAG: tetratricopeptide repeat protein [Elusimicrobiota bacterium]
MKYIKIALSITLVFSINPSLFSQLNVKEVQEQAVSSYRAGEFPRAVTLYKQLLNENPDNVDLIRDLMWSQWMAGQTQAALDSAIKVKALKEIDIDALSIIAKAYFSLEKWPEATKAYKNLLYYDPENLPSRLSYINALISAGNISEAEQQLNYIEKNKTSTIDLSQRLNDSWSSIARVRLERKEFDLAVQAYKKVLGRDASDEKARIGLAHLYTDLRKYDEAQKLLLESPSKSMIPRLARVLQLKRDFSNAAYWYEKATELFDNKSEYRFQLAQSLLYSGKRDEAVSTYEDLLNDDVYNRRSLDILVDEALARGNDKEAAYILRGNLSGNFEGDWRRKQRLAIIYLKGNMFSEALGVANQLLSLKPNDGRSLIIKASCLLDLKQYKEAIPVFKKILELNPYNTAAVLGLSDAYESLGQYDKSYKLIREFRKYDITNPFYLVREANNLYELNRKSEAKKKLTDWLLSSDGSLVPVLCYHGLTNVKHDPILAHPEHVSIESFENHMNALKKAGFETVTAVQVNNWFSNKESLPKKPILITFDDGRLDSFRNADPVLEKNDQKATMFAIVQNIERELPAYANWNEYKEYQATGRWDVQAHGDFGHSYIQTSQTGDMGLYLVNRKWLHDLQRLEFPSEWKERVHTDHKSAKEKIKKHLGTEPIAFAFPEGNLGQIEIPNYPQSAPTNVEIAQKEYGICFYQDRIGLNTRIRNPIFLTRVEPPNKWTGEDLIKHISDKNPANRMQSMLLRWALWEGKPKEALYWLEQLKKSGVSKSMLLAHESMIHSSRGDLSSAEQLLKERESVKGNFDHDFGFRTSLEAKKKPSWTPGISYQDDNRGRHNLLFAQTLDSGFKGRINYRLIHKFGRFTEKSVKDVYENALGLGFNAALGLVHNLDAQVVGSRFSQTAPDTFSGRTKFASDWTDNVRTEFSFFTSPVFTSRALLRGLRQTGVEPAIFANLGSFWKITTKLKYVDLTDNNKRVAGNLQMARVLKGSLSEGLKVVYKGDFDDTEKIVSEYYSPQVLIENRLGLRFDSKLNRYQDFYIQDLPGYGKEKNVDGTFVNSFSVGIKSRWKSSRTLNLNFSWDKSATYRSTLSEAYYSVRF